jgi:voltage-gated potassium channel
MIHKRILTIALLLLVIFIFGMVGYMLVEGWDFLDSLYMTIITLTTVGFMEVKPLSEAGRYFTIILLVFGFSIILYGLGSITAFFVEGELMGILRRKRMKKQIDKLSDHYIICGAGTLGWHVIHEFVKTEQPFVVVERGEDEIESTKELKADLLYIHGDASSDDILCQAGIKRAKGLIATFAEDKNNLFVVLTARSLNPQLRIVARATDEETVRKMYTAGADAVVSPHSIGGMRMASEMLRPAVVSFLDIMLRTKDRVLRIEEAVIEAGSKFEGVMLKDANIPQKTGLIVIAVKNRDSGEYIYNPGSDLKLKVNDVLIILGDMSQLGKLKEFTSH